MKPGVIDQVIVAMSDEVTKSDGLPHPLGQLSSNGFFISQYIKSGTSVVG